MDGLLLRFVTRSCAITKFASNSPVKGAFPEGADDGIRTHTPLFARTDFKSVASTIPPHRRGALHIVRLLCNPGNGFAIAYTFCSLLNKS
jgi:hypothetical protein